MHGRCRLQSFACVRVDAYGDNAIQECRPNTHFVDAETPGQTETTAGAQYLPQLGEVDIGLLGSQFRRLGFEAVVAQHRPEVLHLGLNGYEDVVVLHSQPEAFVPIPPCCVSVQHLLGALSS